MDVAALVVQAIRWVSWDSIRPIPELRDRYESCAAWVVAGL